MDGGASVGVATLLSLRIAKETLDLDLVEVVRNRLWQLAVTARVEDDADASAMVLWYIDG